MATVALIPSVLGLRPGYYELVDSLRERGHDVRVVDIFGGGTRDCYEEGMALVDSIGQPELMKRVVSAAADVPDGFVAMGLSMGAVAAQYLATQRTVSGAVLLAGAATTKGWAKPFPAGVPVQIHVKADDEFATEEEVVAASTDLKDAGAKVEIFTYPGQGHLFMDRGLPDEYDGPAADLMLERVLAFLDRVD